jgi:hydrogenase/urease accessory protein HupE
VRHGAAAFGASAGLAQGNALMNRPWTRVAALAALILGLCAPALAHTPDISTGKIKQADGRIYHVDVGFLATDLERIFSETMSERSGADISQPGVLETELGRLVQRRLVMKGAGDKICPSSIEKSGEDPTNADSALIVLRFDCSAAGDPIFYDATKLLAAQGSKGKHLLSVIDGVNPGETLLVGGNPPVDLSKPLMTTPQLMVKFALAGVEHILTGYDHVCFLIAVILWARRAWPVVKIVTAFTVSHSITLSLAALNIVTLPTALTEAAIAASIIYVALENFVSRKTDTRWRDTFLFGFIHGFGFASGLAELGVPQGAVLPALAAFNIGVEIGQIVIVLALIPLLLGIDKFTKDERSPKLVWAVSAVIALFGAYWLLQRIGVLPG